MSSTPSTIGSPNTSNDETFKRVSQVGTVVGQLAPIGDLVAELAGADPEDVKVGTTAALAAIPGLEALIASFIKIFG